MKHATSPALILTFFGCLFAANLARCQQATDTSADMSSIPDAASTTQATTCTERSCQPCPEWVHKLIGQYPLSPESGTLQRRNPSPVHFWTYRSWQEPPLRTNKEVFRSKLFVATHVGGAIAMIVACRNNRSREK